MSFGGGGLAIPDRLYTNPPRTADGTLDESRLTTGEVMDALYTHLYWTAHRSGSAELHALLDEFGGFFVDYAWTVPGDRAPTPQLVQAADALLRLGTAGAGWESEPARGHVVAALEELRAWAASLG